MTTKTTARNAPAPPLEAQVSRDVAAMIDLAFHSAALLESVAAAYIRRPDSTAALERLRRAIRRSSADRQAAGKAANRAGFGHDALHG